MDTTKTLHHSEELLPEKEVAVTFPKLRAQHTPNYSAVSGKTRNVARIRGQSQPIIYQQSYAEPFIPFEHPH